VNKEIIINRYFNSKPLENLPSSKNKILGVTNSTPLKNNLVLEISKIRDATCLVFSICFSYYLVLVPKDFFQIISKYLVIRKAWVYMYGHLIMSDTRW
jgi:hypothetical protein